MKKIYKTLRTSRTALMVLLMGILLLASPAGYGQATLTTDKLEYAPGEKVLITGSGWQSGEQVSLMVMNLTYPELNLLDRYFEWFITADSNGSFTSYWDVTDDEIYTKLVLTALGQSSGYKEQVFFSDGRELSSLSVGAQTGSLVGGTANSATYLITVNSTGSGNVNNTALTITGLPSGASGTFSPTTVNPSNGTPNPTSTLTITTATSTPAGTFTITVRATNPDKNATTAYVENTGILVIKEVTSISHVAGYGVYGNNITLNAVANLTNVPVNFILDGVAVGSATTNGEGLASLVVPIASVPATLKNANTYTDKVTASITGTSNYSGTSATGNLTVSKRNLYVTATGQNKTYDGTTAATVTLSHDALAGDDVTANYTSAAFTNKNIGTRPINVSGISISGAAISNYIANTTASTSATISKRDIHLTITGINKVYNATRNATVTISTDKISTDDVTGTYTSAEFDNKNVGDAKPVNVLGVNIIGSDAPNYNLVGTLFSTTANITPKDLTVFAHAVNRVYDATNNASGCVYFTSDKYAADAVHFLFTSATFDNKNVGTGKIITVTGLSLIDLDAKNYTLTNTTATTSANITKASVTVTAQTDTKIYDGTTNSIVAPLVTGIIAPDVVGTAPTQSFDTKNVGTGKTMTAAGLAINDGNSGNNYAVSYVTNTSGEITPKPVTITAVAGQTKIFGQPDPTPFTYTSSALEGTDVISGLMEREAGNNVGNYAFTLGTLTAGANYSLSVAATPTFSITPKPVLVTAVAGQTKVFGQADPTPFAYTHTPLVGDDVISGLMGRASGENVNTYAFTLGTLTAGANYSLSVAATPTFSITPKPVLVTAIADQGKYCGQVDPTPFAYTHTPLVGDDVISGLMGRASGENVNTYAFTLGTLTAGANYSLSLDPANPTFSIYGITVEVSITENPVELSKPTTICVNVSSSFGNQNFSGIPVSFTLDDGNSTTADLTISGITSADGTFCTTKSLTKAEVYSIIATAGCATSVPVFLAVFDPNGGFVTGGGWFYSIPGAYRTDLFAEGKANFGFVSKYKKGSNTPEGNTEFQFHAGKLNFSSSSYNTGSLVIAGPQAIYKGVGTINGVAGYSFMVSAIDGQVNGGGGTDKFRIKIWETTSGQIVYDNQFGDAENANASTVIGGGSIMIQQAAKTKSAQITTAIAPTFEYADLKVYPNPFSDRLKFEFVSPESVHAKIDVYDMTGRMVQTIFDNAVEGGIMYNAEFKPEKVVSAMYFYRMTLGETIYNGKVVYKKE